jgi:hypothetical protein
MLCEKLSNLRLDRLGQQRTRAAAQDLCQGVGEDPWLGDLERSSTLTAGFFIRGLTYCRGAPTVMVSGMR